MIQDYERLGRAGARPRLATWRRCGLANVGVRYGWQKWGQIPIEGLLADPPRGLLVGENANAMPAGDG